MTPELNYLMLRAQYWLGMARLSELDHDRACDCMQLAMKYTDEYQNEMVKLRTLSSAANLREVK